VNDDSGRPEVVMTGTSSSPRWFGGSSPTSLTPFALSRIGVLGMIWGIPGFSFLLAVITFRRKG
jgi:hypothetical protein